MLTKTVDKELINKSLEHVQIAITMTELTEQDVKAYMNNYYILHELLTVREYFKSHKDEFNKFKKSTRKELEIDERYI